MNHLVYDSFGNITSETNPEVDFRFSYTGREFDEETGQYYYRARYYDAAVGEFINEDTIGFSGGDANLNRYVGNSPTNYVDPSGNQGTSATDVFIDLVVSGLAATAGTLLAEGLGLLDAAAEAIGNIFNRPTESTATEVSEGSVSPTISGGEPWTPASGEFDLLPPDAFDNIEIFPGGLEIIFDPNDINASKGVEELEQLLRDINTPSPGVGADEVTIFANDLGAQLEIIGEMVRLSQPGKDTKGRTTQQNLTGDFQTANELFDLLDLKNVGPLTNTKPGIQGRVGQLEDGTNVIVRNKSSNATSDPTLEIQYGRNKRLKFRFIN